MEERRRLGLDHGGGDDGGRRSELGLSPTRGGEGGGGGVGGGLHDDDGPDAPSGEEEEEVAAVDPVLFYEITQHLLGLLARFCAMHARSSPMVVVWYKVKECGILLPKDTAAMFLYVCGMMGIADSIGMMSSGGISGAYPSPPSHPDDDRVGGAGGGTINGGSNRGEEERFLVPKEVATYHDLSSKPTEASISLRIKSLVSKGDARSAESMLEAFKVRDYCVVVVGVVVVVVGRQIFLQEAHPTYFPTLINSAYLFIGEYSSIL
jgi:hypothetical protein